MNISELYQDIYSSVQETAIQAGLDPAAIHIIAVSKTQSLETVQEALDAGIVEFGENKVQEASEKFPRLHGTFLAHFIGHLQTNKAKQIIHHCPIFHSIDRIETAQALHSAWKKLIETGQDPKHFTGYFSLPPKRLGYFLQVNTTNESSKSGIDFDNLHLLAESILKIDSLVPLGLMTIGPTNGSSSDNRRAFALLRTYRDHLREKVDPRFQYLSMGMSDDYKEAIQEGATHLRIGSAIFGKRYYQ